MKLNQATTAAFLSVNIASSLAAFSHEKLKDEIVPLLAPKPNRNVLRLLQMTDPSSECSTDTEAIAVDETYYAAFENATNSCPQAETQEGNTITVDYSVCDPDFTNSLTEACNAVNGKLEIQRTITILLYFSFFFSQHIIAILYLRHHCIRSW